MAGNNDDIIVKVTESPIILQYTKQGIDGATGPVGPQGADGISWELAMTMSDSPNGSCTMTLYKDGEICSSEIHYVHVKFVEYGKTTFVSSAEFSKNIQGTMSFSYTNTRAILGIVYDDATMERILCVNSVNHGKAATIKVGTVKNGSSASVTNVGNPTDAIFNFVLPKGNAATISVGNTETLIAGSPAYVRNVGTSNDAVLEFGIPNGGGAGARVENTILYLEAAVIYTPSISEKGVLSWTNNAQASNPPNVQLTANPIGEWSSSANYSRLDIVSRSGGSYMAKKTVPANTAVTNTTYWLQIASKGEMPTIGIGTVQTANMNQNASVTVSGTASNPLLNFTLPRGSANFANFDVDLTTGCLMMTNDTDVTNLTFALTADGDLQVSL